MSQTINRGSTNPGARRTPDFLRKHRAWKKSWLLFSACVTGKSFKEPSRDGSGRLKWKTVKPPSAAPVPLFQIIMRLCVHIPAITNTDIWRNRSTDLSANPSPDVVEQWGKVLCTYLTEDTEITVKEDIQAIVQCYQRSATRILTVKKKKDAEAKRIETERMMKEMGMKSSGPSNFKAEFEEEDDDESDIDGDDVSGLSPLMQRNLIASVINSLGKSATNAYILLQYNILSAIGDTVNSVNWERTDAKGGEQGNRLDAIEYKSLLELMKFLVKSADVGMMISQDFQHHYRARDWARAVFRVCHVVLDPLLSDANHVNLVKQIREQALSAMFIRINPKRCPNYHAEQTCAVFEVPGFLKRVCHWFYQREQASPEFEKLTADVINSLRLARQNSTIPSHHKKSLGKCLHHNKPCQNCNTRQPEQPLLAACPYCTQQFYCNEQCRQQAWHSGHSRQCKHAWKAQVKSRT